MNAAERAWLRAKVDEARRQQFLTSQCLFCHGEFIPNPHRPDQMFCRSACKAAYHRGFKAWTAEEDALLVGRSASEAAELTGRTRWAVLQRRHRLGIKVGMDDIRHGTRSGYNYWRCRCDRCRGWMRDDRRKRRESVTLA